MGALPQPVVIGPRIVLGAHLYGIGPCLLQDPGYLTALVGRDASFQPHLGAVDQSDHGKIRTIQPLDPFDDVGDDLCPALEAGAAVGVVTPIPCEGEKAVEQVVRCSVQFYSVEPCLLDPHRRLDEPFCDLFDLGDLQRPRFCPLGSRRFASRQR